MKPPTEQELRELDYWIAENFMGWSNAEQDPNMKEDAPHYTTGPAAAMMVLKEIVRLTGEMPRITKTGDVYVWSHPHKLEPYHDAPTLELAICEFAKQLKSK